MKRMGYSTTLRCVNCGHVFWFGEPVFLSEYDYQRHICKQCSERENMPNIKITAEVDGKQVPLETVSTETFEAIKALEKPKEILVPVARVGNWEGRLNRRRLILKVTNEFKQTIVEIDPYMVAVDLENGKLVTWWADERDAIRFFDQYQNVITL